MMKEITIYICPICGNMIFMLKNSGVIPICCNKPMTEVIANTSDGATEKHIPVVSRNGRHVKVHVGEVLHPMIKTHYIEGVAVLTNHGIYYRSFEPDDIPTVDFEIDHNEKVLAAYAYCNLHGLWRRDLT